MIIRSGTYGFPVPGVQFNGRKLFLEARSEDSESDTQQIADYIGNALRQWADLTNANYTTKLNIDELAKTKLED